MLRPLHALLGIVLLPALSGFRLAIRRNYDLAAAGILLGQLALAAALLALALAAFERRELVLTS